MEISTKTTPNTIMLKEANHFVTNNISVHSDLPLLLMYQQYQNHLIM